jgi:hypothetical protein
MALAEAPFQERCVMADVSPQSTAHAVIDWIQDRFKERTSWDGATIILMSILALAACPLVKYAAWVGLGYGIWTIWKQEKNA